MMVLIPPITSQLGFMSEIGCLCRVDEVVQNGHASNHQQCSYQTTVGSNVRVGASSRAEETRVQTKTGRFAASVQSGSGDKFKETGKLWKNVRLKQWGEEGCSQIGHQKKKKNTFFWENSRLGLQSCTDTLWEEWCRVGGKRGREPHWLKKRRRREKENTWWKVNIMLFQTVFKKLFH